MAESSAAGRLGKAASAAAGIVASTVVAATGVAARGKPPGTTASTMVATVAMTGAVRAAQTAAAPPAREDQRRGDQHQRDTLCGSPHSDQPLKVAATMIAIPKMMDPITMAAAIFALSTSSLV